MRSLIRWVVSPFFVCLLFLRTAAWTFPRLLLRTFFDNPLAVAQHEYLAVGVQAALNNPTRKPWMIFLSVSDWEDASPRVRCLMTQLAVLGLDVTCCAPVRIGSGRASCLRAFWGLKTATQDGLTLLSPLLFPGENTIPLVRFFNSMLIYNALQREIQRRSQTPEILMAHSPFSLLCYSWLPTKMRIYDVMETSDAHFAAPPHAMEHAMIGMTDCVCASTSTTAKIKKIEYPDIITEVLCIPNGVEAPTDPEAQLADEENTWEHSATEFAEGIRDAFRRRARRPFRVTHLVDAKCTDVMIERIIRVAQALNPLFFRTSVFCLRRPDAPTPTIQTFRTEWITAFELPFDGEKVWEPVFSLINMLRLRKTDILHTHSPWTHLIGRLISRITGMPVFHGHATGEDSDLSWWAHKMENKTRPWATAWFVQSDMERSKLIADAVLPKQIVLIPDGVATVFPLPQFDELTMVCCELFPNSTMSSTSSKSGPLVGIWEFNPRGDTLTLLAGMPKILEQIPQVRILITSNSNQKIAPRTRQIVGDLNQPEHITIYSKPGHQRALLALMDLVVFPIRAEESDASDTTSMEEIRLLMLDTMAMGKPIVATRLPETEEIVSDEECGLLVSPNDPDAFADAIATLLNNKTRAQQMGWAGRKRVEAEFSVLSMAQGYENAYRV
ncbi:TPA: hypothetical protein DDW35_11500 [Candidatus Sumerlaeota bacterium]|nr:hypothetical protein [Candidatus Sumerlaeota bacterium]